MRTRLRTSATRWLVAGGLLVVMGLTSTGYVQAAALTATEKSWLTYMREEEKVARDVYLFLYDVWGASIFSTIAGSEQRHMDAVKSLLDKYGLADPAAGKAQGEFTNPELQALYEALVTQGSASLVEALNVGVLIEETDLVDLQDALAATNRRDITNVYTNLMDGSLNHLKAFQSNLAMQ